MAQETLLLLQNIRQKGYDGSLTAYLKTGGYEALTKALSMPPKDIIETVKASGLRGRGGAGFSTGVKWNFMPGNKAKKPCYLICNADESEPGTFKDHVLMLKDPHLFLEGMLIGCWALHCKRGYIYIRGESYHAIRTIEAAIEEARAQKLLGAQSPCKIDLVVHPGAGAYICGEETALLDSLEGKRGQPRFKPPFPAQSGFDNSPTTVNNVETLANIPFILNHGPQSFQKLGLNANAGTQLVCISGHVKAPGVYEVPMGFNLLRLINGHAQGVRDGKNIGAVIPGGASSQVLKADEVDIPYDFENLSKAGSMRGSGAVMVFDENTDIVELANRTIRFFHHESCGQCTPCREGTFWLKNMVRDFLDDMGSQDKVQRIERVAGNLIGSTICAFGEATGGPMQAFVRKYPKAFKQHYSRFASD